MPQPVHPANSQVKAPAASSEAVQAFAALTASPGARAFYDHRRAADDTHHQALRALGNRLVGILHGCMASHTPYSENTAWAHRTSQATTAAQLDTDSRGTSNASCLGGTCQLAEASKHYDERLPSQSARRRRGGGSGWVYGWVRLVGRCWRPVFSRQAVRRDALVQGQAPG